MRDYMAVFRNRRDSIGATHIPVAPRLLYKDLVETNKDSPEPILLGSGAARLALYIYTKFTMQHLRFLQT